MRLPNLSGLCLSSLLLYPGILFAQSQDRRDSLATGTVLATHNPNQIVKLGRKLNGEALPSGWNRWNGFGIFWGYTRHSSDSATFGGLRPGEYSVWAMDTAYRLFHESFTLEKGGIRYVDARIGTAPIGKKAAGSIVDKASKAPLPGATVSYECVVRGPQSHSKLELHSGTVVADSLGRFETPPCLNKGDSLYVRYLVDPAWRRDAFVKMKPAMDKDSLWSCVIELSDKRKPMAERDKQPLIVFSALTYSMGFPLSGEDYLHAFSHSLYSKYVGIDYGFEAPNGSLFVNVKGWMLSFPVIRGNWSLPLGIMGTGLGLYRTPEEDVGYQAQVWYNLLLVHVNLKLRKDFGGSYHSTLGLGISLPVYIPGRR